MKKETEIKESKISLGDTALLPTLVGLAIIGAVVTLHTLLFVLVPSVFDTVQVLNHINEYANEYTDTCERKEPDHSITQFPCSKGWHTITFTSGTTTP